MSAKWILVAGASRGIGLTLSRKLIESGFSIIVSARNKEQLEKEFSGFDDDKVKIITWDFSDSNSIQDYSKSVNEAAGKIKGLVYCAGIQMTLPLSMNKQDQAKKIFEINTFSAMELIRCFSKKSMVSDEGASFVLISSLAAKEGALGKSLYGASKGALEGFMPSAATELAQRNIRLNIVAPGVIKTDMSTEFLSRMSKEQYESLTATYPLGLGGPEDAANVIYWLLSDESKWVTGQTYIIDGGHMIRG
jgi:NAD(P)-dependent dehydrogenase (short-subunit alcohol dehydrogenase family)